MPHNNKKILATLDRAAARIKESPAADPEGRVVWSKDGIVLVSGLEGCFLGELVTVSEFEYPALVMQVESGRAYCVLLAAEAQTKEGQAVRRTAKPLTVPAGEEVLGRVVDPLGLPLDGGPAPAVKREMPLEAQAPAVLDRQSVSQPLHTGIKAIDALIPIGRGQRELIIGDRQTGKTAIALDAILAQKGSDVACIYVAVGQRDGKTAQVIDQLSRSGAMAYTTVVSASASQPAALQYLAPYAGCAIGEYFMSRGRHALIVYDDLSKHAVAYREISLLLRRPPGREAYPGDVFYLHSRLLERAAKLKDELGGGSLTALPIIETQAGDVSAYIPTNVISITDGQIFLESKLFYKGIRPAINIGVSVSRVGGAAQSKLMKKISGTTKLSLAQYYELAAFAQFSSELDAESQKQLELGRRLVESFKQQPGSPQPLWREAALLWAVQRGYFDGVEAAAVFSRAEEYLGFLESAYPQIARAVAENPDLDQGLEELLRQSAEDYFKA